MAWLAWIIALLGLVLAAWLWRQWQAERVRSDGLSIERVELENRIEALRANEDRMVEAARRHAFAPLLGAVGGALQEPLSGAAQALAEVRAELADYRACVRRFDEAVQYCLQPVELLPGADQAGVDALVRHVEVARQRLFEARAAVTSQVLHGPDDPLQSAEEALHAATGLAGAAERLGNPTETGPESLQQAVDTVLAAFGQRLGSGIQVDRSELPADLTVRHGAILREALVHLLGNALDAVGDQGSLVLAGRQRDGHVELSIRDSGTAMTAEILESVFEPFFSTRAEQAGLGLPLTRRMVENAGGSLVLDRTAGGGAIATLLLPAA